MRFLLYQPLAGRRRVPPREPRRQGTEGRAGRPRGPPEERVGRGGAEGQPEGVLSLLPHVELEDGQ